MVLQQSIASFAKLLAARQESIERTKAIGNDEDKAGVYCGLRTMDGHIDERYADQMTGL